MIGSGKDQAFGLRRLLGRAGANSVAVLDDAGAPDPGRIAAQLADALGRESGLVLLEGALDAHTLARGARHALLVVAPQASSITRAYATIKRLHRDQARREFRVLVRGAGSADEGRLVFDNLARVSGRFLALSLRCAGWLPRQERQRAAALRRLAEDMRTWS